MDMHVIDDATMQELLRFVKAHHTFVRHNRVYRERNLKMAVCLQQMKELTEKYLDALEKSKAPGAKQKAKRIPRRSRV